MKLVVKKIVLALLTEAMRAMRNIFLISVLLAGVSVLLLTCSEDEENDAGSMTINGTSFVLSYGQVDEAGLSEDSSYMNYWIRFQSSEGDYPSHFLVFKLYSNRTIEIGEGTYSYAEIMSRAGYFSWVKAGFDLHYNEANEPDEGTVLLDSQVDEGSMIITKQGSGLNFEFNITFTRNNTLYTVTGNFTGALHEGNVYYTQLKK